MLIYNDRIISYRRMKELDAVIDSSPSEKRIRDLADYYNRNLLSFKELKHFNANGKWLNKHPLLAQFSLRHKMEELLQKNSDAFLEEFAKTSGYVARYKSYLNNLKRSEQQHEKDRKNLNKYEEREQILKEILNERKREQS